MNVSARKTSGNIFPGPHVAQKIEEILADKNAVENFNWDYKTEYIPDASYMISQSVTKVDYTIHTGPVYEPLNVSKYMIFFRADGKAITAIPYSIAQHNRTTLLDPNSEKPMIFSYRKYYRPAMTILGMRKCGSDYIVIYYDANGFQISYDRINWSDRTGNELATFNEYYDWTNAIALEADYSKLIPNENQSGYCVVC